MVPRKSFKTEKGTELPLLNLKGKEYLQVMHRLVWLKEKYPTSSVSTELVGTGGSGKDEYFVFKATISIDGKVVSTGHKRENVGSFADALEKAESGAIGRACAVMGIGTQFAADDLDEGSRLADSPAPVVVKTTAVSEVSPKVSAFSEMLPSIDAVTASSGRRPSFRKSAPTTPTVGDDI